MYNTLPVPGITDIQKAAALIAPYAHRTPVLRSESLNAMSGAQLFFKCENFQKVGAFKFRGGCNAVLSLNDTDASSGVATHSSGNHAQAIALAAKMRGIPAYIVMPENSPKVKVEAVKGYGAEITFCTPTLQAREETLEQVVERTGAIFIHPYDNAMVIAGQGTSALELLQDQPDLDIIMAPVGGGGLLSGTAIAAKALKPDILVYAAEPSGADDAYRSFRSGTLIPSVSPDTIADGLRTSLGTMPFDIIMDKVNDIFTVSDEQIIEAMKLIWQRMKIIIEPSCAVPFAAVLDQKEVFRDKKVGIILTGGNVDLDALPWM